MSGPAPAGARCAGHPEAAATWTCKRCGAFMCLACERRVRPDALPLCPSCWSLRDQKLALAPARKSAGLETAGLWLGVLSFTCLPPVILASLVVNAMALARAQPGAQRKPVIGLVLTVASILVAAVAFTRL